MEWGIFYSTDIFVNVEYIFRTVRFWDYRLQQVSLSYIPILEAEIHFSEAERLVLGRMTAGVFLKF